METQIWREKDDSEREGKAHKYREDSPEVKEIRPRQKKKKELFNSRGEFKGTAVRASNFFPRIRSNVFFEIRIARDMGTRKSNTIYYTYIC